MLRLKNIRLHVAVEKLHMAIENNFILMVERLFNLICTIIKLQNYVVQIILVEMLHCTV